MESELKMTDYERKRLENIKRNREKLAALNIRSRLSDLFSTSKRIRKERKSYKQSPEIKKEREPVVKRRSHRTRGMPPDVKGLPMDFNDSLVKPYKSATKLRYLSEPRPVVMGPCSMKYAYVGTGSCRTVVEKFCNVLMKSDGEAGEGKRMTKSHINGVLRTPTKPERKESEEPIDPTSLKLEPENIARVVPKRIFTVRFFPTTDMTMVVAGDKLGHLGFWDIKLQDRDEDMIHLYRPHSGPISGIFIHPFYLSKMYSCCYEGFLRLLNVEREQFDLVYSSGSWDALFSLSQQPNNANSIYFGEGKGDLHMTDGRDGKITNSWSLHTSRINSIDFNPTNPNIMATSSSDGLACLWDLRKTVVKSSEHTALQSINHGAAVHSAYFSPSGSSLATTSFNNNVGVLQGENKIMIPHNNRHCQYISKFRAIWGWDDTYLFVGNMKRKVDILSVDQRKTVHTLESPLMSAIPCRYDAHPCTVGMLAGGTAGGQIYIWMASL